MGKELDFFEKYLFEAEDTPEEDSNGPPDMPEDDNGEGPPDLPDISDESMDDGGDPPDMDDGGFGDDDFDDMGDMEDEPSQEDLRLNQKISAIMNDRLYSRYLKMLSKIGSNVAMSNNNSDMLYTLSPESLDVIDKMKELDENIRLYIDNYYTDNDYSENLLFYNQCLNLLRLLNITFDKLIKKGIKETK